MKTSITPRLNYRADYEGRYSLIIQIIHDRRRSILTTPHRLYPEEFDTKRGCAVAVNRTKAHRIMIREANESIATYLTELGVLADKLKKKGVPYTAQNITELYKCNRDCHYLTTFAERLIAKLEQTGHFGTARAYRSLMRAWGKFARNTCYRFSQLDIRTITAFSDYLEQHGNRRNTVSFYLRTLRALYNRARKQGYAPEEQNPFRGVSFKAAKTPKLAVTRELLNTLASTDFEDALLNEARDMFLFSFYARGMSFVDMAYLEKEKIWDGALHYRRHKTHQTFKVAITAQLREIIDRYDTADSPWVLPCMRRGRLFSTYSDENTDTALIPAVQYKFYCMALQYYLTLLHEISKRLGCRKLTFNVARHTWATEARSMGVPMPHISEGLGHTSEQTTRFYLAQLDNSTVDKVNEMVTKLR